MMRPSPPRACASVLIAFASALTVPCAMAQTPARDATRPVPVGTATLSGTVVTDEPEPRPLRRVRVGITTSDRQLGRTVVTDDAGRFAFTALPAGRYLMTASKQGYVTTSYGARRPNRPGTTLVLADGQRVADISLRMPRGAVVTGVIVDQNGEPYSGVNVAVMRNVFVGSGQRTLLPSGSAQTDDRGQFRVWGLPAGDYVVSANPGFVSPTQNVEIARLTDADIRRALADVGAAPAPPGTADKAPQPRTVGYATVFYPGTATAAQATPIKVGPAEERTGIDFALSLVPTAKVEGSIAVPEGFSAPTVLVQMLNSNPQGLLLDSFRRATPAADGKFSFAGVPPGTFTIMARAMPPPAPGGRAAAGPAPTPLTPPAPTHFAMADVTIEGQDIAGLTLTLQTGLTVSGRILFEGTAPMPDVSRLRINLMPVQSAGEVSLGQSAIQPDAQGAFSIPGVVPGRYRLTASIPGLRPDAPGWQIKGATIGGRDALDLPVDVRESTDAAAITLTDRVSELSGLVLDSVGQPAPEYTIVVFARDRNYWTPMGRRIRSARPAADGKYSMPGLPPGEYLVTAVTDLEPGEQSDPAFLDVLSRSAVPVAVLEGEKKTFDCGFPVSSPETWR